VREPVRQYGSFHAESRRLSRKLEISAHAEHSLLLFDAADLPREVRLCGFSDMKAEPVVPSPAKHAAYRPQREHTEQAIERP
jgi:hypothetical protein